MTQYSFKAIPRFVRTSDSALSISAQQQILTIPRFVRTPFSVSAHSQDPIRKNEVLTGLEKFKDYLDLSPSDKANYSRNSVLSFPDIVLDPGEGGDYVALNLKTGNFMHVSENSKVVEGHVIEDTESLSSGSINLSDYISSHEKIEGRSLGELQEINVTLKGLFLSEDPRIPTISTGGGYSDEAELNIYIGTPEEPCEIIGRGGQGGSGMISEGVIYENGQPTEIDSDLNPPLPGGDGLQVPKTLPQLIEGVRQSQGHRSLHFVGRQS